MKGYPLTRSPAAQCMAVALLAALVLLALSQLHDIDHLYVAGQPIGLNDQAGYITTARWFADTGELRSHLIYPAYVDEPRWRLYMPGQYCALAAAYKAFGDHPWTWRVPALVSFVLASVGVFLIGRRLFDGMAGWVAAVLFMLLPANGAFAFTAMPQLPFIALGVGSFCAFCYLPARRRALWVPLLLVPPFLIRETGALLVIPMAWLSMGQDGSGRVRRAGPALFALVGSVMALATVLAWQIGSGKGALPLTMALTGGFNYPDAFAEPVSATLAELAVKLPRYAARNLSVLLSNATSRWMSVEPVLALILLAATGLLHSAKRLAIGVVGLLVVTLAMVTFFYEWQAFRGTRSVLFVYPLCALAAAPVLGHWIAHTRARTGKGRIGRLSYLLFLLPAVLWSARGAEAMAQGMRSTYGARTIECLDQVAIDRERLFVSPFEISLDYTLANYPIRWSFVPLNARTLRLVDSKHEIGTLIIRPDQLTAPMAKALHKLQFLPGPSFTFEIHKKQTREYLVFHRPAGN
ncbi:MAG: hypothetical protein ACI8Y8_002036 [Planctomycetota bacterium]|jgi:hypothetical protein